MSTTHLTSGQGQLWAGALPRRPQWVGSWLCRAGAPRCLSAAACWGPAAGSARAGGGGGALTACSLCCSQKGGVLRSQWGDINSSHQFVPAYQYWASCLGLHSIITYHPHLSLSLCNNIYVSTSTTSSLITLICHCVITCMYLPPQHHHLLPSPVPV